MKGISFEDFFSMLLEENSFKRVFEGISDNSKEEVRDFYRVFFRFYKITDMEVAIEHIRVICGKVDSADKSLKGMEILEVAFYRLNEKISNNIRERVYAF